MKTSLLLLLFIVISLSGAARPNLRFLRSIPNRIPRIPITPIKSDVPRDTVAIEGTDNEPIIPPSPPSKITCPSVFTSEELKSIYMFFIRTLTAWNKMESIILNNNRNNNETAIQYCNTYFNFDYDDCVIFVNWMIGYLEQFD